MIGVNRTAEGAEMAGGEQARKRVLVAVSTPMFRVIEHLLHAQAGWEVLAAPQDGQSLADHARRVLPSLVVANMDRLGCQALADVKRSSPWTQVILLGSVQGLTPQERQCDGATYLDEESVVRRLLETARQLSPMN